MRRYVAATALAILVLLTVRTDAATGCLEDEVRMYSGECVPLDDITEAAIDLYVEANMQQANRYTEGD